jgi:hypothetical protein
MKITFWKSGIALVVLFVLIVLGKPSESRADFSIYNNLGPNNSYNSTAYGFVGTSMGNNYEWAEEFIPSASGSLSGLNLGMIYDFGNNIVTLSLLSNANGALGNTLWSQTFTNQLGSPGSMFSVSNLNGPMLNTGSSYWLVAGTDSTSAQAWFAGFSGNPASMGVNGSWTYNVPNSPLAMEVMANNVTPTPIPASFVLMGSGLLGLVGLRQRVLA